MKLTGFIILTLWVMIGFWPTDSPEAIHSRGVAFIEHADATAVPSLPLECSGIPVIWAEVMVLGRRQRPYRNPLRRLRKKLRAEKRKKRGLLKGGDQKVSAAEEAAPLVKEEPEVELEAIAVAKAPEQLSKKRGRKATISTNHIFCPNESCRGYQVLGPHSDHQIIGAGTYTTKWGQSRQLYRCQLCKKAFSETRGTVFFGLKSAEETIYRALACLCEGMGIRATARVFVVKPDTILNWLRQAGQHCEMVSAYLMQNLHVEQVQLDELWTFVFKKEKTLSAWEKLHSEYGDTWVWTALDPTHKLVLSLIVGEHEEEEAVSLLEKLKAVVVNGCLPLLVSDQLPHYVQAILKVFGRWIQPQRNGCRGRLPNPRLEPTGDLHYATVNKQYRRGKVDSVTRGVVFGSVKEVFNRLKALGMKKINTSFVERMNLTLRHLVSRLRRRGLTFSKKRQYLKWHLNLAVAYYHFVRPHIGLRRRLPESIPTKGNGSPKKWDKRTPAMSAELTDHIWSIQELLTFRVPQVPAVCT